MAASLLFHAVVLTVLGWRAAPRLTPAALNAEPPAVELSLVRPTPSPATSRPTASRAANSPPPLAALPRPAAAPLPVSAPAAGRAPLPTPAPSAPMTPPAGSGTGVHPGPMPGADAGGDFRGFLRAGVGCSHQDDVGLTRAEREICNQRAGGVARGGARLPIPDDKLAGYSRQAETDARRRAWRDGALPPLIIPCPPSQAGSNLGMGCLPKEASHTVLRF